MPRYSWDIAKSTLSEVDKNRLLAIYLTMDNPNATTNWDHATQAFGAASIESMKVMTRTALKKIKDAGGELDASNTPLRGTPKKTPTKKAAAKGGRKRKASSDDEEKASPSKRSKGRKVNAENDDNNEHEAAAGSGIKEEYDGDD